MRKATRAQRAISCVRGGTMGLMSATLARSVALGALLALVAAVDAGAQPTADIAITAVAAGQCAVTVTVSNPAAHPSSEIDLDLNGLWIARQTITARRELTFRFKAPLEHLDELRVCEIIVFDNAKDAFETNTDLQSLVTDQWSIETMCGALGDALFCAQ
jgi:hypothetical protein